MARWEAVVNMKIHSKVNTRWRIPDLHTDNQDTLTNMLKQVFPILVCFWEVKGQAIPLHGLKGPEGSRRFRLPDIKTICT
jgi:hypothetical protein